MRAACLFLALGLGLISGCSGYRLGPTNGMPAGSRTVQVRPFVNPTFEPRLGEAVTSALRRQLQQDGTFRLETQGVGDVIVSGTLTQFHRNRISLLPSDVRTVQDYDLSLTARVTAMDRVTGKIILEREVRGQTIIRVGADLASAERQAIPLLAADLARNATAALVDGTW